MLSVIICTHNPRPEFIARTLESLKNQSLDKTLWELVIVDNASNPPLLTGIDLNWHPRAWVVREEQVGLTAARLAAIEATIGETLVWVDDDNLLDADYLEKALHYSTHWPMLGIWGCGRYKPEWEEKPSPHLAPYISFLAVREAQSDRWSNRPFDYEAMPAGAGLCSRRAVALRYAHNVRTDKRRLLLGRNGGSLAAGEDFDFALTATQINLGTGVFRDLSLTHIMPKGRIEPAYLDRLAEGHAYSTILLMAIHVPGYQPPRDDWKAKLRRWRRLPRLGKVERALEYAKLRGEKRAAIVLEIETNAQSSR